MFQHLFAQQKAEGLIFLLLLFNTSKMLQNRQRGPNDYSQRANI